MGLIFPNPRKTDVFFDTKKLGRLYIFTLVVADTKGLYREIKSVEKTTPAQYVRLLIKYVCHPEGKLGEGKDRPEQPTLTDEQISLISEPEFEDFAEKYITKKGLGRSWISKPEKREEGANSATTELGEVEHPRNEGEKWVDYLHRLAVIEEKGFYEQIKKIAEQFSGMDSFSKKLQDQIKDTFSLGESLKKSYESLNIPRDFVSKPHGLPYDITYIKPFGGMPEKIDKLIETSAQSAEFLIQSNRTQTGIANELKSSGEKTAWYSKWNIAIGIIIVALTVLAIYLTGSSLKSSDKQSLILNKNIEAVRKEMKLLNESTKTMLGDNKSGFERLIQRSAEPQFKDEKLLLKLIEQQNLIISELRSMREQDRIRIEKLEERLREMSVEPRDKK
jgi:hypothetical protein